MCGSGIEYYVSIQDMFSQSGSSFADFYGFVACCVWRPSVHHTAPSFTLLVELEMMWQRRTGKCVRNLGNAVVSCFRSRVQMIKQLSEYTRCGTEPRTMAIMLSLLSNETDWKICVCTIRLCSVCWLPTSFFFRPSRSIAYLICVLIACVASCISFRQSSINRNCNDIQRWTMMITMVNLVLLWRCQQTECKNTLGGMKGVQRVLFMVTNCLWHKSP